MLKKQNCKNSTLWVGNRRLPWKPCSVPFTSSFCFWWQRCTVYNVANARLKIRPRTSIGSLELTEVAYDISPHKRLSRWLTIKYENVYVKLKDVICKTMQQSDLQIRKDYLTIFCIWIIDRVTDLLAFGWLYVVHYWTLTNLRDIVFNSKTILRGSNCPVTPNHKRWRAPNISLAFFIWDFCFSDSRGRATHCII